MSGPRNTFAGKQAFVYSAGAFTTFDVPGGCYASATGINARGKIVGTYNDAARDGHSFLYNAGVFTTVNVPGGRDTRVYGINAAGQLVGEYYDPRIGLRNFLATPAATVPEPVTLALVAAGPTVG